MPNNVLDRLGEILITRVRDKTISDWDKILDGRMKGATAERVRAEIGAADATSASLCRRMIPRIVDTTIHHLLWTLEQEESIKLSFEFEGTVVSDACAESDGLSGELYGGHGWIARFSNERNEEV